MLPHDFFHIIFVFPILNLLVALYKLFLLTGVSGAFGFAILALTIIIRLILHPFFHQQLHTAKKMQDIKPHLDKLSAKHKKDPKKLQSEQMRLYKEAGINPASGCLFMVIQIPVFIGLYQTLQIFLLNGSGAKIISQINSALYAPFLKIQTIDPNFFIFNLSLTPQHAGIWYYYAIPLITALLQYLQVQYSTPQPAPSTVVNGEKQKDTAGDFQKALNTQMKFIFPLMIGWFSYTLPVGLSLYWNIFSIFSIIQYQRMHKKVEPLSFDTEDTNTSKALSSKSSKSKGK